MGVEFTKPARDLMSEPTLPLGCVETELQFKKPHFSAGTQIGNYKCVSLLALTHLSEIWFARAVGNEEDHCVIKFTKNEQDGELQEYLERIQQMKCRQLVPVLECDETSDGYLFTRYPYYKRGNLKGPLSEQIIKSRVLPCLISSLKSLHTAELIHNDVKPENLFWSDDGNEVLLGDFGCVTQEKTGPRGYTLSYCAPELVLQKVTNKSSDWFSVGMTLAALAMGKPLLEVKNEQELKRAWEYGIECEAGSADFQRLVNGMLNIYEPKRRLGPKASQRFCDGEAFGTNAWETDKTQQKQAKALQPYVDYIPYDNPVIHVADISGFLDACITHWNQTVFYFGQGKLDAFLEKFDRKWFDECKRLRKKYINMDGAVCYISLLLSDKEFFVWRGVKYYSLLAMEQLMETNPKDIEVFVQDGLAYDFLRETGANEEQLAQMDILQQKSRTNPIPACKLFFQELKGDNGFEWKETIFFQIGDVLTWLENQIEDIDDEIEQLVLDDGFSVWMSYIGYSDIVTTIRERYDI